MHGVSRVWSPGEGNLRTGDEVGQVGGGGGSAEESGDGSRGVSKVCGGLSWEPWSPGLTGGRRRTQGPQAVSRLGGEFERLLSSQVSLDLGWGWGEGSGACLPAPLFGSLLKISVPPAHVLGLADTPRVFQTVASMLYLHGLYTVLSL